MTNWSFVSRLKGLLFFAILIGLSTNIFAQSAAPKEVKSVSPASSPVLISEVSLSGVTIFDPTQLWAEALSRSKSGVDNPSYLDACNSVKNIYREAGYFLAEVSCSVKGSKLQAIIHEGMIRKIEVSGVDDELAQKISAIVTEAIGNGPVKLSSFERGVMLAKDLAGVSLTTEVIASDNAENDLLTN